MNLDNARAIAQLVEVLDNVRGWYDAIEADEDAEKHPLVQFGDISSRHPDGQGRGWDGEILIPRDFALYMLETAEDLAIERLKKLGVQAAPRKKTP